MFRKQDYSPKKRNIHILIMLIVTSIMMIAVNLVAFQVFKEQLDSLFKTETEIYLNEISSRGIDSVQRDINGDIELLKGLAVLLEQYPNENMDEWITLLNNHGVLKNFDKIGIILPNGEGYGQLENEPSFADQLYFKSALNGGVGISNIVLGTQQQRAIHYAVPIIRENQVTAVICAVIDAEVLERILNLPNFEGQGKSYIVGNDGSLIIHSNMTGNAHMGNIFLTIDQPNKDLENMQGNMLLGKNGDLQYTENGVLKYLKYTKMDVNHWYLITVIPETATTNKTKTIGTMTLTLTGLVSLVLLASLIYHFFVQSKHKRALMKLAYVDEVTGAFNKERFKLEASELLKKGRTSYAFILLDVYKFKLVNDIYGYACGDLLLKHMARVITEDLSKNELFARIEGDKFYILLEYATEENIIIRLEQMMDDISAFQFNADSNYKTVVCAGIYLIEDLEMPIDSMSDRANLASRKIKGHHQNQYFFYNDELRNQLIEEQEIENDMHQALQNREFQIYLQPKYDIVTEKIVGAEALVRWLHPEKGLIPPVRFIPLFEKDGFVTKVDMYVLDEVCKRQKEWIDQGKQPITISVNQSKLHLYNKNYLSDLKRIIDKYELNPRFIELEITESAVFDNVEVLIGTTKKLHEMGFKLSIDDFGTGYSSLNMLKDITLDTLKLDGAFFSETADIIRSQKITEHIIMMSKDLGMTIVAEGVETKEQVDFLREIGCDIVQGFYYAKPMPMEDFFANLDE